MVSCFQPKDFLNLTNRLINPFTGYATETSPLMPSRCLLEIPRIGYVSFYHSQLLLTILMGWTCIDQSVCYSDRQRRSTKSQRRAALALRDIQEQQFSQTKICKLILKIQVDRHPYDSSVTMFAIRLDLVKSC